QVLQDKEKHMSEIASKLDDPDYLDSLSPEAEAELKHKFRMLNQELSQQQQQLYQTLSQANFKVVQKLTDSVNEAAEKVAKDKNLDIVINEDACFFFSEALDITDSTVDVMDKDVK
ncbi:MAG: OmpH family outer membrane protein, partial [Chlamydiota bacterium]